MSEKIYAYLLLLFPRAFRRYYQEEALRLLRDRLRDESGIYRRLRLSWDLLVDVIRALPQAHRNSYAEATHAASLAPNVDGVPSFQILEREPIRRETIVSAFVLSLSALGALMYAMEWPVPYQPVQRNGRISPVEAVLERYHEATEDLASSDGSGASAIASIDTSQPESTRSAGDKFAHSAQPTAAPSFPASAGQQAVQGRPGVIWVPGTGSSDMPSYVFAPAEPSSPASVSEASPDKLGETRVTAPSASPSQAPTPAAVAAYLSGEWALRIPAGDAAVPRRFMFRQNGAELRGTGGRSSTEQYPLIHGSVADDSVKFELRTSKGRFLYHLRLEGKVLQGTLSITSMKKVGVSKVRLERVR
jgi:hypothetical protein